MTTKRLHIFFVFLLLLSGLAAKGGTITEKIDSLKHLLETTKEDTQKVNILNRIAFELRSNSYDTAMLYAQQALQLAEKFGFNTGIADAYNNIALIYSNQGNYSQALDFHFKSLKISESLGDQKRISSSFNNIANIYDNQGNYSQALDFHFKSLKTKESLGDKKGIAASFNNIATIYDKQGNYSQALDLYFKSLKIKESLGDKKGISNSFNNIANIYFNQGNYSQALDFHFKSLKISESLGDKKEIAGSFNNIAGVYYNQGNYSQALDYFFKSFKIRESLGNKKGLIGSYVNIGDVLILLGSDAIYNQPLVKKADSLISQYFPENPSTFKAMIPSGRNGLYHYALQFLLKSINMGEEIGDKQTLTYALPSIGMLYIKTNRVSEAIPYYLRSIEIAKEIGSTPTLSISYLGVSEAWFQMSNQTKNPEKKVEYLNKAFSALQNHVMLKDTLFNEESIKSITEMQTKYETEKKEQQIKLLEKEGELQKSEVRRQKFIIWSVAGGLLIVVVFSFFIFKERRKSEKLLLNILPVETARELKKKGKALPRYYKMVTVLFTDFKGFTKIAEKMSVEELVSELDFIFRKFDEIISKYPIEKIKTIGDAYMCAGGLPVTNTTNPIDVVMAALDIQQFVEEYKQQCIKEGKQYFEIRIGVHTGPVVAGVVGDKKFAYDIWGDTVNTASRMESSGEPGKVNISGSTYQLLQTFPKFKTLEMLKFTFRGKTPAKNKGEIEMYFVEKK